LIGKQFFVEKQIVEGCICRYLTFEPKLRINDLKLVESFDAIQIGLIVVEECGVLLYFGSVQGVLMVNYMIRSGRQYH
jgi:hypothetical protein